MWPEWSYRESVPGKNGYRICSLYTQGAPGHLTWYQGISPCYQGARPDAKGLRACTKGVVLDPKELRREAAGRAAGERSASGRRADSRAIGGRRSGVWSANGRRAGRQSAGGRAGGRPGRVTDTFGGKINFGNMYPEKT